IEGIKFKWKQNNEESIGLIAQDVEKVFPEIVNTPKNSHKSIQYGNLVAPIIEAIKELSNDFETVKKRLDLLEKKI
ncbi:tail fiber domain-containing protein, partial [Candidatus Woesearchaeota archaeon]|nr:tail fiber domain-containing protein [Candidatus Woesearchaeota archaeon]